VALLPSVARQTLPRFDLYAELGVEPSADSASIEAAYRSMILRWDPDGEAGRGDRRIVRARLAREWLTDPERRGRYDASRARAAARASGTSIPATPPRRRGRKGGLADEDAAAAEAAAADEAAAAAETEAAAEAAAAAEAQAGIGFEEAGSPTPAIPWPTEDLERSRAAEVATASRPRRRRGIPIAAGIVITLLVIGVIAGAAVLSTPRATEVAVVTPTSTPAPTPTQAIATPNPTPEPTIEVTAPPPTETPIDMAAFQGAAWQTIQDLMAAAADGDVAAAQALLGDTAPGLRASGLKRATFPEIAATDIAIQREGDLYTALAGLDRLTSTDGTAWAFDYAERPLALYRSPAGEPVHDLYWLESDGKHDIFLRVAWATLSRSGVTVRVTWSYDPSRPDDATYFRRAQLSISSAAFDESPITVTGTALPMAGVTTLTPTATFIGAATVPDQLSIGINVTNPRTADGSDRAIESIFKLAVR